MRAILVLFAALFAAAASADVVFTTSDYKDRTLGIAGAVNGVITVKQKTKGFGADPVSFSYSFGNNLLVANRSSAAASDDSIYICDTDDISKPLFSKSWEGARNIYDAEYMFGYLYVICYNDGKIIKVETNDFTKVAEYAFDNARLPSGFSAKGVSLAQLGGQLYALFAVTDESFAPSYEQSWLVKLDENLTPLSSMTLPENAHTVTVYNNRLYVASWGGAQTANANASKSKLQVIVHDVMGVSEVFSGADIDGAQIAGICFSPDGTAFVATHMYSPDGENCKSTTRIYRIATGRDGIDSGTKKLVKTLGGWMTTITYDPATSYFWVANSDGRDGSDQLLAFNRSDGSLVKSFSSAQLGGPAYSLAQVSRAETPQTTDSGGNGGCSTAPVSTIGMLLIGALFAMRRK